MDITVLEFMMLDKIAHNEHQPVNTATPKSFEDTDAIWALGVIESNEDKGVFSSLLKKGLVGFQRDSDGNICWLTHEGFLVWQDKSKSGE